MNRFSYFQRFCSFSLLLAITSSSTVSFTARSAWAQSDRLIERPAAPVQTGRPSQKNIARGLLFGGMGFYGMTFFIKSLIDLNVITSGIGPSTPLTDTMEKRIDRLKNGKFPTQAALAQFQKISRLVRDAKHVEKLLYDRVQLVLYVGSSSMVVLILSMIASFCKGGHFFQYVNGLAFSGMVGATGIGYWTAIELEQKYKDLVDFFKSDYSALRDNPQPSVELMQAQNGLLDDFGVADEANDFAEMNLASGSLGLVAAAVSLVGLIMKYLSKPEILHEAEEILAHNTMVSV